MQAGTRVDLPQNPRERANPLSLLCFCYTMPVFFKGRKKELEQDDLYRALNVHSSENLGGRLNEAWDREVKKKTAQNKSPSLIAATMTVFGLKFFSVGMVAFFIEMGLRATQPIFLGALVSYYSSADPDDQLKAYLYAGAVILSTALNVMFTHAYTLSAIHLGMKIRVAMCSLIYRKSLRLSKIALGDSTAGQVVNLISNDVSRLDVATMFIHYLWIGPIETGVLTYLMYREIGVSATFGVIFMFLFIPFQGYLGKKISQIRLRTAMRTDERVRLMNEIIQGIQVIKMYAWEIPFNNMVEYVRRMELEQIRYVSYVRGVVLSFLIFVSRVSIFLSLVGYVLLGHVLTPEKAFAITAYYNILKATMNMMFPQAVGQLAETMVSFGRIQTFMLRDEIVQKEQTGGNEMQLKPLNGKKSEEKDNGVILSNIKAKWDKSSTDYTLDDVSLTVKPGTLVAIIGTVGSGKSSLLQAILGELPLESGTVEKNGTLSYASQEPWIFSATVRQNILFGLPMDRKRYNTVVQKCALARDFELLPNGDKTVVGERGASLSGGQKARISLARAVYRQASVYLLDDPLSAVDTHVGRHLFDQCMRGFLRDSTVILITHQLQFLQEADQIAILEHGKLRAVGTYDSLRDSGLDFAELLAEPAKEEVEEKPTAPLTPPLTRTGSGHSYAQRRTSQASIISFVESIFSEPPMQIQETQKHGAIGWSIYRQYLKAGGGFFVIAFMLCLCVLTQMLASGGDFFLSYWVDKQGPSIDDDIALDFANQPPSNDGFFEKLIKSFNDEINTNSTDIYIFTGITVLTIIVALYRSYLFFNIAIEASRNLHNAMFSGITRATMYFFNTNPSGRILNRFSKDMGQVDEILPAAMIDVIQIFMLLVGIIVVISIVNPIFLVPTVFLAVIFYFLRVFYLQTSRNVKRIEAIARSPVYSHLGSCLTGLSTIRAFEAQETLIREFDTHQDMHSSSYYTFLATSRAFGLWLDCFCVVYITLVTLSFFVFPSDGADVGLAITQAMGLTGMVQWGMRQSAELENTMTAVERVVEYDTVDPEPAFESTPEKKPPQEWPEKGEVKFVDLSMRYAPDPKTDCVLKNLNFTVQPKEKVGIVGRTGAGKSSLINALFRLSYNDGVIVIDNRETAALGLHDLRSKISIIPQEPVLFSGTMRYNLDPFDEYSDAKLWESLEEVNLKDVVSDMPQGLQSKISEGGGNFSVGQRQLVCLARAILRENKVLVLDEATANVDPQTDALIQATIRDKFSDCTVLTIAHRLNTVMDSDKVLVMDAGRVVEFASPYELLTQSDVKVFEGMAKQTGKAMFETLLAVAKRSYDENNIKKKMQ